MFDYHMHSTVSFDGHDTPEKMALAAKNAGLREVCFTDHIDDDPRGIIMDQRFSLEAYSAAYDDLEIPGLKIRRGVEFGLLPDNQASLKKLLSGRQFDFVIGSIHYADGADAYFPPYWEGKTLHQAESVYLQTVCECVKAHDDFDVLGHLTYLSKARANPVHTPIVIEEHRQIVDEILKVLVSKGKGMEINTSGVDRTGDFLPPEVYLRRFKELGGQIVTVGSDAHTWDRVGQYTQRACQMVMDIFGYVCTYEGRKPIFHRV